MTPMEWAAAVKLLKTYFKHSFSLTAMEMDIWYEELAEYDGQEVIAAVRHRGRHADKGFPLLGEIIQFIEGKADDAAALAWGEAKKHLARMVYPLYAGGQVVPIPWTDARIPAAIEALGGASTLMQQHVDNEMATRAHFAKAFMALSRQEAEDDTRKRMGLPPKHVAAALAEAQQQALDAMHAEAEARRLAPPVRPGDVVIDVRAEAPEVARIIGLPMAGAPRKPQSLDKTKPTPAPKAIGDVLKRKEAGQ